MDARSDVDEDTENTRTELGGHQHLNASVVFLHAHGVGSVHMACVVLSDPSCQTDDANLILRIANGPDRNYPR